jgi:cell cycle sensor histidine kinase DivJ
MASLASRIDGVVSGWVHSDIADEDERRRQTGLFRMLVLACPALMVLAPLFVAGDVSPAAALAAGIAASAVPMLLAAALCVTGSRRAVAAWGLLAAAAAGGLIAISAVPLADAWTLARTAALAGALGFGAAHLLSARTERAGKTVPQAPEEAAGCLHDLFPGLVTLHDLSGNVLAVHGADAAAYREWLVRPMGRGFFQQIHVGDRIAFLQAIDAIRRGEPRSAVELRMHRASFEPGDDQFVHLHIDFTAIRDETGQPQSILGQSRDVTAEAALRRDAAEKTALAESANSAKTRFLAAVSHELRTPLNAIIGFSDVLAQEYFGRFTDERQREYVELIRQSGAHLLSVVNTMLDMSRIEAGRFELIAEPFDVAEAVAACESMLSLQARQKGVTLTSRVNRDCGELVADRRALNQILINLVANAVKFTEKGGVVTIDAGLAGDRLRFSVSDTGIGISPEELADLGRPFVQAQSTLARRYEGTGLGLSLVKGLVALHGGAFEIMSAPGEGTVVTVELARDGSGVRAAGPQPPAACAVEFPPRLVATTAERKRRETDGYDDAQARTA